MSTKAKYRVVDVEGITQHVGTWDECKQWIANAAYLFGASNGVYSVYER